MMDVIELWWLSLAIFAVVVVVVAVLLGLIIAAAKSIDHNAADIWTAGKQIAGNTVSIWLLEKNNESVTQMASSARSLEHHAVSIDEKLTALGGRG
jgi:cell division protein FtsN